MCLEVRLRASVQGCPEGGIDDSGVSRSTAVLILDAIAMLNSFGDVVYQHSPRCFVMLLSQ